ncbi:MAG: EAL domain-containing protein [Nitriliruptoraceae bacterium]
MSAVDAGGMEPPAVAELARFLPDAAILIDEFARVVWANRAAERLFGVQPDTGIGLSGLDVIHPDDFQLAAVSMASVRSKEVGSPIELRVRTSDGWRLVEVLGAPIGGYVLLSLRDLTERRRWEVAGTETARFRAVVQYAASIFLLVTADGVVSAASGALTRALGHDQEYLEQRALIDVVDDQDHQTVERLLMEMRSHGSEEHPAPRSIDVRLRHAGGPSAPFALTFVNLLDDPTVQGLVVTGHDITDRSMIEDELRQANSLLSATLQSTTDGILVVNPRGRVTSFNDKFAELWRLSPETLSSLDDKQYLASVLDQLTDPGAFLAKIHELYADPQAQSHDILELNDGRVFERSSLPQRIGGNIVGRVWSFRDVTEQRRLEGDLIHQAFHDTLTGLANRALFIDHVEQSVARLARDGSNLAVLFIDIDNFKQINDSLGHSVGDAFLIAVSERLRLSVRPGDTVARLGGDEFAVVVDGFHDPAVADEVAQRIMVALREPVLVDGYDLSAAASVGIAFDVSGASPEELLRNADLAMYAAKASGKNCARTFTPEMHVHAVQRLDLEAHLKNAIDHGELVVHYQPIVDLATNHIHGFEALVRWDHRERGLLLPSEFVPFAEETGLIDEIGDHVLAVACEQTSRWHRHLIDAVPPTIAVNISPRQLLDRSFPARVEAILEHHRLQPAQLTLEVTESALMREPDATSPRLQRLRRLGVRIAVDDFGTGYSSLAYLSQFPVDQLKIDRSFVSEMLSRPRPSLAGAIVQIAHTLGLDPIAEGVENQAQADALSGVGCELAQGFHLGRPLDADTTEQLLMTSGHLQ